LFKFRNSITYSPIPKIGDIFKALFTFSSIKASNYWVKSDEICLSLSRSAYSIKLVSDWRQNINREKQIVIWLPDFFCNESLEPLRQSNVKLVFYPVDENSIPLWSNISNKKFDPPDIFFLVHYFGNLSPSEKVSEFCKKHCAWLVEDATHAIEPQIGLGDFGDIVLYSPHKHFAIPDGAFLIVRKDGPSRLLNKTENLKILYKIYNDLIVNNRGFDKVNLFWILKRLLQRVGVRAKNNISSFDDDSLGLALANTNSFAMSAISNKLLAKELRRIKNIKSHRKECALQWEKGLSQLFHENEVKFRDSSGAPYLTFLSFQDKAKANIFFYMMQKVNLPVSSWPDLPPEVLSAKEKYPYSNKHRHSRIYLPVHQTIKSSQISYFIEKLIKAIEESQYE
jgi:dTDP-4-amino-4,6-dideoxygalactose transaminase